MLWEVQEVKKKKTLYNKIVHIDTDVFLQDDANTECLNCKSDVFTGKTKCAIKEKHHLSFIDQKVHTSCATSSSSFTIMSLPKVDSLLQRSRDGGSS